MNVINTDYGRFISICALTLFYLWLQYQNLNALRLPALEKLDNSNTVSFSGVTASRASAK